MHHDMREYTWQYATGAVSYTTGLVEFSTTTDVPPGWFTVCSMVGVWELVPGVHGSSVFYGRGAVAVFRRLLHRNPDGSDPDWNVRYRANDTEAENE